MKKVIVAIIALTFALQTNAQTTESPTRGASEHQTKGIEMSPQKQSFETNTFGPVAVDASKAQDANVVVEKTKTSNIVEDITIIGSIKNVCQAKGCWATIALNDGSEMTVKFKDYAFFMPKDCAGKTMTAHGKAFTKQVSVAELKHLAEDAGKSKKEIKKITQPQTEVRFEADGVILN